MQQSSYYQATQPYHYDREEQQGTNIPPGETIQRDREILLSLPQVSIPDLQNSEYGNPQFLRAIAMTFDLEVRFELTSWAYDNRWTAQDILPFMMLGPLSFARDVDKIREAGVTMIVAVRSKRVAETRPSIMDPAKFKSAEGLQTATFDVDTPYDIVRGRSRIIKAINDHLERLWAELDIMTWNGARGKVLVFCETGNERSPILPALYLMTLWGVSAVTAVQVVQARRFGIGLNTEMIDTLKVVHSILDAERQVASAKKDSMAIQPPSSRKRVFDRIRNIHDNSDDAEVQDEGAETNRIGSAPFMDNSS